MHFTTTLLATLTTLTPITYALGNAVVTNNCPDPVYLWSVGSSVGPKQTIEHGANYTEPFRHDSTTGGIALKITRNDNGLYDGSAQMTYSYTLDSGDARVWYDLSDVFGDPFSGEAVVVKPEDGGCRSICWPEGVSPGGSQVKDCAADGDVGLTLCAEGC